MPLRNSANTCWRDSTKTTDHICLNSNGSLNHIAKRRRIRFYDTQADSLRQKAHILHERVNEKSQECERTLKFDHPDRYVARTET